jgi:hypothetical protein
MNTLAKILLRCLGLNRPAPKTRFGRCLRRSERILGALAMLYIGLHAFPQTLFSHSVTVNGITIYSRSPLPPEASSCTARAAELLKQSELAVPDRHESVFVCDSPWLFRLFQPASRSFAFSVPMTDNVFVAAVDFHKDTCTRSAPDFNTRSFSAVVAHEITHGLIRHRIGLLPALRLPDWVDEGYCDYVSRESSFPEVEGLRLFSSDQSHPSMSYHYFSYRQMVCYLVDSQHLTFSQVVARAGESAAVEVEARESLRQKKTQ